MCVNSLFLLRDAYYHYHRPLGRQRNDPESESSPSRRNQLYVQEGTENEESLSAEEQMVGNHPLSRRSISKFSTESHRSFILPRESPERVRMKQKLFEWATST